MFLASALRSTNLFDAILILETGYLLSNPSLLSGHYYTGINKPVSRVATIAPIDRPLTDSSSMAVKKQPRREASAALWNRYCRLISDRSATYTRVSFPALDLGITRPLGGLGGAVRLGVVVLGPEPYL